MSRNPYAPPQAALPGAAEPLERKRWIAALLGLLAPPIAMLYVVRPLRAVAYVAIGVLLFAVTVVVGVKGIADPGVVSAVASIAWPLIGAVDGYRLAPSWTGTNLPWYSRPLALVGFLAAALLGIGSVRAFVVEPFRIPSGSMQPTLRVGDHILVSKRSYGWDVPLTGRRMLRFAGPRRGDVAVFRFPQDRNLNYVMRVVGLPGETIAYANKRLRISEREIPTTEDGFEIVRDHKLLRYRERLDDVSHSIFLDPSAPPFERSTVRDFPGRDQCRYHDAGFTCSVPAQHYFVMGDNRDNTFDSRYWGFVPEDDFLGRAFLIWYSPQDSERGGTAVQ